MADGTAVESLTVTSLASPEPCRQLLGGWLIGGPDLLALSLLNAPFAVNSCRRGCAKGMKKTGAFGTGLAHASWGFAEMSVGETGFEPAASCSQSKRATKLRHSPAPQHHSAAWVLSDSNGFDLWTTWAK